jgi:hypothetical protein
VLCNENDFTLLVTTGTTSIILKVLALILMATSGEETEKQLKFTVHKLHKIVFSQHFKNDMNDLVR